MLGPYDIDVGWRHGAFNGGRLTFWHDLPRGLPLRDSHAQVGQRLVQFNVMIGLEELCRLLDAPPVASDEAFEKNRVRPEAPGLRRRPPLAPQAVAVVEEKALDDNCEVGPQAAAAFESSERFIVALDEVKANFGGEILGFGGRKSMATAHLRQDIVDDRETRNEDSLVVFQLDLSAP